MKDFIRISVFASALVLLIIFEPQLSDSNVISNRTSSKNGNLLKCKRKNIPYRLVYLLYSENIQIIANLYYLRMFCINFDLNIFRSQWGSLRFNNITERGTSGNYKL